MGANKMPQIGPQNKACSTFTIIVYLDIGINKIKTMNIKCNNSQLNWMKSNRTTDIRLQYPRLTFVINLDFAPLF